MDDERGRWPHVVILVRMVLNLAAVAAAHGGAFTRAEAQAAGYTDGEIRARLESGRWLRLRRGVYVEANDLADLDGMAKHQLACRAALRALEVPAVISHHSSAVLAAVDTHPASRQRAGDTIELTTLDGGTARRYPGLFAHRIPVDADEWVEDDGIARTTVGRTIVDLSTSRPFVEAVVAADSALHQDLTTRDELLDLASRRPRRGKGRILRVISFANGLSESVGESVSRVALAQQGLPDPELQYVVADFRSDFAWPEFRTLGEFDGRLKYTDPTILWAEKLREDALRDAGWELIRWTWAQINSSPEAVAQRLRRAFSRAARRTG